MAKLQQSGNKVQVVDNHDNVVAEFTGRGIDQDDTVFLDSRDYGAKGDYVEATGAGTDDTAAIQAAISDASAAKYGIATVLLPPNYAKLTSPLVVPINVELRGFGCFPQHGSQSQGFQAINIPLQAPHLRGSVLVQTTAGANAVNCPGMGGPTNLRDFGIMFGRSIRFSNTGHGVFCQPPASGSNFDNGLFGSQWDNVFVYGHDGNHYAFTVYNQLYNRWGFLQSWGGGGMYFENNAPTSLFYGNLRWSHGVVFVIAAGSAHGVRIVKAGTAGKPNLFHFGRLQCSVQNVGTIGEDTPTPPTSAQQCFFPDTTTQYVSVAAPDFESNVGSTVTFPTVGSLFLGPGGPGGVNLAAHPYFNGDQNFPNRAVMNDLALYCDPAEAAGSLMDISREPAFASITVPSDSLGPRWMSIPGVLLNRAGPSGDRPADGSVIAGAEYYDIGLSKPIWSTGAGWVDATGGAVASAGAGASVATDAYNRANNTTSLGLSDTTQRWKTYGGTFGINTNAAYCPAATTIGNDQLAWLITNRSDCTVQVTLATRAGSLETGMVVRLTDRANFWRLTSHGIRKVINGAAQAQTVYSSDFVSGDVMAVVLSGNTITVKKNGTTVASVTDAFNQTATAHGIRSFNDNSVSRWDNFSIVL